MDLPQGFNSLEKSKQVCRLIKSLYRLKQASRQWNDKLKDALIKQDHSLLIKRTSQGVVMILVYVYYLLII